MKYYAMYDKTVSKQRPGQGFANTKAALCFSDYTKMQKFIENRWWDYSCKRITRDHAMKYLESNFGDIYSKGLFQDRIFDDLNEDFPKFVIFRESVFNY